MSVRLPSVSAYPVDTSMWSLILSASWCMHALENPWKCITSNLFPAPYTWRVHWLSFLLKSTGLLSYLKPIGCEDSLPIWSREYCLKSRGNWLETYHIRQIFTSSPLVGQEKGCSAISVFLGQAKSLFACGVYTSYLIDHLPDQLYQGQPSYAWVRHNKSAHEGRDLNYSERW